MRFIHVCQIEVPMERARAFFNSPLNLLRITPLGSLMDLEPKDELKENLRIRLSFLGFTLMESLIRDVSPYGFTDIAIKKPPFIRYWEHRHILIPKGNSTVIEDHLTVEGYLPEPLMRLTFRLMFIYRCRAIKRLLK